jgi:hypothetical protein
MRKNRVGCETGVRERGATLVMVGVSLVALLSVMALAIDLGMLYVARSEAQRAADAAALGGASALMKSGCQGSASGCVAGGTQEGPARLRAESVGQQNYVMGQPADIQDTDISFTYPSSTEPQITVVVRRTVASGNAIPTIFAKMFGVSGADVTATATAEAFQPGNQSNGCVVPFLMANCDTNAGDPLGENSACPPNADGSKPHYFYDRTTGETDTDVIGKQVELHFGTNAAGSAVPSQWYMIAFDSSQSGSQLQSNIQQCAPQTVACGDKLQTYNGASVGPVTHGVNQLINATPDNCHTMNCGQDLITVNGVTSSGLDYTILGGANNPNQQYQGVNYAGPSPSEVTAPLYDGHQLQPGSNGQTTNVDWVEVIGYVHMFIQYAGTPAGGQSPVYAVVESITKCVGGSSGKPVNTEWSPIPIRLIRTQ